ncbi:hypothetical protein [Poseidonibacter ostreae]|uniref:hypothetical protein n=1 Tax=Poseidonibacter ostreae TaxID=2654171 RepID=UPI00186B15C8|nr:hypothetical protein [Poseidonibacter ostreae]
MGNNSKFNIKNSTLQKSSKIFVEGLDEKLFVSKYKIVLPSIKELEELVKEDLEDLNK